MTTTAIRGELRQAVYPTRIDDILNLREPHRTYAIEELVGDEDPYGVDDDEKVLIKTHDGKPVTLHFRGRKINISPKGRRVPRSLAVELLRDFGKDGYYTGKCLRTGIRKSEFDMASDENRRRMGWHEGMPLHFFTSYLTHIEDEPVEDDEAGDEE